MRLMLAILMFSTACGGGKSDDTTSDAAPKSTAPTPFSVAVAAAKPKPKPVDLSLGDGFQMRYPIRDGNLAIVPIVETGAPAASVHYVTLADGLARHEVTVRELGRGDAFTVDKLRVKNKSHEPLFVMTGEIVFDGMQDRVIAEDRVIPPGRSVRVAVRCVEMSREAGHLDFHASNLLAELQIRQAVIHQTQTEVWATVDAINQHHHLTPSSKTYREAALLQNSPDAQARRDRLIHALAQLPDRSHVVGLAQVISGHVVSVERFATPELFGALEGELLGSYVASDEAQPHEGRTFLPADVRALAAAPVARMTEASFVAVARP